MRVSSDKFWHIVCIQIKYALPLLLLNSVFADGDFPEKIAKTPSVLRFSETKLSNLPPGLKNLDLPGKRNEICDVAYYDFNQDGVSEIVIKYRIHATAGPYTVIFKKSPEGYQEIFYANCFNLTFIPTIGEKSFQAIEGWTRGGGGFYTKLFWIYEDKNYKLKYSESYENQKLEKVKVY